MQNHPTATPPAPRPIRWRHSTAVQAARVLNRVAGVPQQRQGSPVDLDVRPVRTDRLRDG